MKHLISKILLSLLMITIQINGMENTPKSGVEYAYINDEDDFLKFAETVRDSILKRGISTVPRSDFDDAQTMFLWALEHVHLREYVSVPKATLTKLLNRLYQLKNIYCPEEDFGSENDLITDANEAKRRLTGYFHREINFSTNSSTLTNKLLTLVQNRLVIAGGGVAAVAAAAWYWFYYLHEPKTEETNSTETAEQPKIIEDTK